MNEEENRNKKFGFWVSMAVVLLIVIIMNVVFWTMNPQKRGSADENKDNLLKEKYWE